MTDIYLADTIGEMGLWYRLADMAFLGGSMVPRGGQNPIEPAKLGVPMRAWRQCRQFPRRLRGADRGQGDRHAGRPGAALAASREAPDRDEASGSGLVARRVRLCRALHRCARPDARGAGTLPRKPRRSHEASAARLSSGGVGTASPATRWRRSARSTAASPPAGWRARRRRLGIPVICVGNLVVGGAGKTPTAIEVANVCRRLGLRPGFLTRGYRGQETGPLFVAPAVHTARDVGDEAAASRSVRADRASPPIGRRAQGCSPASASRWS